MRRRRGEELDSAIRGAVLDLLVEHGPGGVTMEAVAAAAGTSKPVLYRRWPDRASLLKDTLLQIATAAIPHEDTGSYRDDMLAILRGWAALFTGPNADLMRAAIAAAAHDPELTDGVSERRHRLAQAGNGRDAREGHRTRRRASRRPRRDRPGARPERVVAPVADHRGPDHRRLDRPRSSTRY